MMSHALIRKLETFGPLPEHDKDLIGARTKSSLFVAPHTDIIGEGKTPSEVFLILAGVAYRYKAQPNGDRQIVAYLLPGDFCDLHVFLLGEMDHSIAALTEVETVKLPRDLILELLDRPAISRAMLMATLVDEATLREWLVNLGHRSAEKRVAHFLCEWHRRLRAIGLASDRGCELPLTQKEIGDTMGLSRVHTLRVIQTLRDRDLIIIEDNKMIVPDMERLCDDCDFRPNYLHLSNNATG